jgi:hypothetical protein
MGYTVGQIGNSAGELGKTYKRTDGTFWKTAKGRQEIPESYGSDYNRRFQGSTQPDALIA